MVSLIMLRICRRPSFACARAFEHLVAESVALDVHLGGGDALGGSGYLEVHVAEVVLIAEDVGEYGIFHVVGI